MTESFQAQGTANHRHYEETRVSPTDGGVIVRAHRILTTSWVVVAAYEPTTLFGHGSQLSIEGARYGTIQSRPLPAHIERLKVGSDERIAAYRQFRDRNEQEARAHIEAAFPKLAAHPSALWHEGRLRVHIPVDA